MKAIIEMTPGEFYTVDGGYALVSFNVPVNSELSVGDVLNNSSMLEISFLMRGSTKVGFFFRSQLGTTNYGGFLMTCFRKKKATEARTIIRSQELVVIDYPNKGVLAIVPKVNAQIETIFLEQ